VFLIQAACVPATHAYNWELSPPPHPPLSSVLPPPSPHPPHSTYRPPYPPALAGHHGGLTAERLYTVPWIAGMCGGLAASLTAALILALCTLSPFKRRMLAVNSSATPTEPQIEADTEAVVANAIPLMQGAAPLTMVASVAMAAEVEQRFGMLKRMLDSGVVSQAEHDDKRAQIIASI